MEISRHVYDIELNEIFNSLRSKYPNSSQVRITPEMSNLEFIDLQESEVLVTLTKEGIDKGILREKRVFVVSSVSAAFLPLIGWRILTIDPYLIEGLLDYQCAIYSGNYLDQENKFIGLLEFIIYPFVKSNNFLKENIRMEKIMNWLGHNRVFIRVSDQKGLKSKLTTAQLESLHLKLLESYIDKETQLDNFLSAFEEKPLPYIFTPIKWRVGKNALFELLELATDYLNKDGRHYLPNNIRLEIVPELFNDEQNHKIILNKKSGSYSKYIGDIEAMVKACEQAAK
ncbi:hypothetical protein KA005_73180 [bacterium]|nr:hypothetical protein [bacterium]